MGADLPSHASLFQVTWTGKQCLTLSIYISFTFYFKQVSFTWTFTQPLSRTQADYNIYLFIHTCPQSYRRTWRDLTWREKCHVFASYQGNIPHSKESPIFDWLVAPWLTGGPGSTATMALLDSQLWMSVALVGLKIVISWIYSKHIWFLDDICEIFSTDNKLGIS